MAEDEEITELCKNLTQQLDTILEKEVTCAMVCSIICYQSLICQQLRAVDLNLTLIDADYIKTKKTHVLIRRLDGCLASVAASLS